MNKLILLALLLSSCSTVRYNPKVTNEEFICDLYPYKISVKVFEPGLEEAYDVAIRIGENLKLKSAFAATCNRVK